MKLEGEQGHVRARIVVTGRVQGVWYRSSVREQARRLGLAGWVRNCYDGSVEVVAEGQANLVHRLIGWCHQGPPGALVTDVDIKWEDYRGEFRSFDIRY